MRKLAIVGCMLLLLTQTTSGYTPTKHQELPTTAFRDVTLPDKLEQEPHIPVIKEPLPTKTEEGFTQPKIQAATPIVITKPTTKVKPLPKTAPIDGSFLTAKASWYGPGFYGHGTACGQIYSATIMGVAHKTLPCGTLVEFHWDGRSAIVPVIDRGPYVEGRTWDLSAALCVYLHHCFTGNIIYRVQQ